MIGRQSAWRGPLGAETDRSGQGDGVGQKQLTRGRVTRDRRYNRPENVSRLGNSWGRSAGDREKGCAARMALVGPRGVDDRQWTGHFESLAV